MFKDVRHLSEQKELEYIKRKEMESRKEMVFKITHFEHSQLKPDKLVRISREELNNLIS